jgi:hypothetical protein
VSIETECVKYHAKTFTKSNNTEKTKTTF